MVPSASTVILDTTKAEEVPKNPYLNIEQPLKVPSEKRTLDARSKSKWYEAAVTIYTQQ